MIKSEYRIINERLRTVRRSLKRRRDKIAEIRKDIQKLKLNEEAILMALRDLKASNSRKTIKRKPGYD